MQKQRHSPLAKSLKSTDCYENVKSALFITLTRPFVKQIWCLTRETRVSFRPGCLVSGERIRSASYRKNPRRTLQRYGAGQNEIRPTRSRTSLPAEPFADHGTMLPGRTL